ncbi:transient receptor potential cation channel protein painless-like [Sitodiplosis mosellana]|uniref:transient receptor potential cation channel protein painless-like n=1 Tax=Sitodiplosis mosellana TaxID=263140 RepID=UPI002445041F|nr:transient receptor potential cation channel protein painless-like [Sitodiplosis mosellana]
MIISHLMFKHHERRDRESNEQWVFIRLFFALKRKEEDDFLEELEQARVNPVSFKQLFTASLGVETLLIAAIREDLIRALDRMIQLGADTTKDVVSPVKEACILGHWRSLEILLKSKELDLNSAAPLTFVVEFFGYKDDYEKCFEIWLNHPTIDINQQDKRNNTALFYSVKYNNALELLNRGAYIGVRNKFDQLSNPKIDAKGLENYFNSCIKTDDTKPRSTRDNNFEIEFDFKNLVHPPRTESITDVKTLIENFSESNDLKHLTMHPLITGFLSFKWNQLAWFFVAHFSSCALFAVITVLYILGYYNYHEPNTLKDKMSLYIFLFTIYNAAREISQLKFLKSMENYLGWLLAVSMMLILSDVGSDTWRRIFAATSILLIAIEIFLLFGLLRIRYFYAHYVMLKTVTWNFLKSFSLYAIIPLAFSLSFFILLHEPLKESTKGETNDDKADGDFNTFPNIGLSIIKTLMMSTGEFDTASINFKTNAFSYIIFMTFVFIVPIVLLNLLNGLAVSDTQTIKSQDELTTFLSLAQLIAQHEGVFNIRKFMERFMFRAGIFIFKKAQSDCRIIVMPNDNNQIIIPCLRDHGEPHRCRRMDSKTVRFALEPR